MKIINNFDKFKRERKEGEFYFIQIIKRKKDNPEVSWINGNNHARCIKEYSIYTADDLAKRKDEMIDIAEVCNARIYVHPARRSLDTVRKQLCLLIAENIASNKHNISWLYRHACGLVNWTQKLWIVDIDNVWKSHTLTAIKRTILAVKWMARIVMQLSTKNWCHLITTPFDLQKFKEIYPYIDVHKNNPTLLYFNPKK